MKTGLVFGKFMPLHRGHTGLIEFGLAHCDRLLVLVCSRRDEPIPGPLRLGWLSETFRSQPRISIVYTDEELPDAEEASRSVSQSWAAYLARRFPGVHILFSSEPYGAYVAEYMRIEELTYDPARKKTPVAARMIRAAPFQYWDFIAPAAQSYFMKKVCLYGPESTGKSTLTIDLAKHFKTVYVPEVARELLGDRHAVYGDIAPIAINHAQAILDKHRQARRLLFCDTDIITTRIYSQHYFGKVPDFPAWIAAANTFDLHLFCDIDVPWIDDPQRDLGHRREFMRAWFLRELTDRKLLYVMISGSWTERMTKAVAAINERWL